MPIVLDGTAGITAPAIDAALDATDLTGTIASARLPAGSVLQVVQNSSTVTNVTTTSTTFVDLTNATATITPSAIANKILVVWTSAARNQIVASTNVQYNQQVLRTSTALAVVELSTESGGGGLRIAATLAFSILDAPNTTSAVTYKIQHKTSNASSTGTANNGFLTLLEIAG